MQRVFLEHVAFGIDLQLRRAPFRLEFHLRGFRNLFHDAFDLFGEFFQHIEVIAENLDGEFGFGAFEHFVEAHFNRLGEEQGVIRIYFFQPRFHLLAQLCLVPRAACALRPVLDGLVENINVAFVGRHWIGSNLARANARKNALEFGEFLE